MIWSEIAGICNIRLKDFLILTNVLYIHVFRLNLPRVSQLTKDLGRRVTFDMDSYMIHAHTKELAIGKSDQLFNLYVFNIADNKGSNSLQQQFAVSSNVVVDDNI